MPTRQTRSRRLQTSRVTIQEEGESFDLDDVPNGDDDDDDDGDDGDYNDEANHPPPPRGRGARDATPTAQDINDPDTISTKSNEAKDIKYFFAKTEAGRVCLECM